MIDVVRAKKNLEAALAIIEDPARWTQRAFARHANGNTIGPLESYACKWCAMGALHRVIGPNYIPFDEIGALDDEAERLGKRCIVRLNDEGSHAEVVEAFRRAIAACEEVMT